MSDKQLRQRQADTRARGNAQRQQVEQTGRRDRGLLAQFYEARRAARRARREGA